MHVNTGLIPSEKRGNVLWGTDTAMCQGQIQEYIQLSVSKQWLKDTATSTLNPKEYAISDRHSQVLGYKAE